MQINYKTIFKKAVKLGGIFFVTIFLLVLVFKLTIQIPAIQNKIKQKIATSLSSRLNATVSIGNFYLKLPKELAIKNILITKINAADTLFYLNDFSVNINLFPLFKHKIDIQKIGLVNSYGDFDKLFANAEPDTNNLPEAENSSKSSPWDIAINRLSIKNCYYKYRNDDSTGFELILDIGKMDIDLGYINSDSIISIKNLNASKLTIGYKSLTSPEMALIDTGAFKMANILIENVDLNEVKINYSDSVGGMLLFIDGEKVKANDILVDVWHRHVFFDKGTTNGNVAFTFIPEQVAEPLQLWGVDFNKADADNLKFSIDFTDQPDTTDLFNFYHLQMSDISGVISNFFMNTHTLKIRTDNLSFKEKSGLNVIRLETDIGQRDSVFTVNKLNIETENGKYNFKLKTTLHPLFFDKGREWFDAVIDVKSNNLNDFNTFYNLNNIEYLSGKAKNSKFKLSTKINGTPSLINIESIRAQLLDSILFIANGRVVNTQDSIQSKLQLNLEKLLISKNNFEKITANLPTDSTISFPNFLLVNGRLHETNNNYSFKGKIESNIGNVTINNIAANTNKDYYTIDLSASAHHLNTISRVGLNSISFKLNGKLNGTNLQKGTALLDFSIDSLNYKDTPFKAISFSSKLDSGKLNIALNSNDKKLLFNLLATGNISDQQKKLALNLKAKHFDIESLALVPDAKSVEGEANTTIDFNSTHNFSVSTNLTGVRFTLTDSTFNIPDSKFIIKNGTGKSSIEMTSQYNNISFAMDEDITQIPVIYDNLRNHYLTDSTKNEAIPLLLPSFKVNSVIDYQDVFTKMMTKNLPPFSKIDINGNYSRTLKNGFLTLDIADVNSFNSHIDNTTASIKINPEKLNFKLALNKIHNTYINGELVFKGRFENSALESELSFTDLNSIKYFNIHTKLHKADNKTIVNIKPDSIIFNYNLWNIATKNQITISPETVQFDNVNLTSDKQKIIVHSDKSGENTSIKIKDFSFGSIDNLLNIDSLLTGIINANINIAQQQTSPQIDGDLSITNLQVFDINMGNLEIPEFKYTSNGFAINSSVKSNYIDISANGNYFTHSEGDAFDLSMNINQINLNQLKYLLNDLTYDLGGVLNGKLKITGDESHPNVNGNLNFKKTTVGIKALNRRFKMENEQVSVVENKIQFNKFKIKNDENYGAEIDGTVAFDSAMNIQPNLQITTQDMVLMNSKEEDNELLYGLLKAQANLSLTSKNNKLLLNSNLNIDGKTNITYTIPEQLVLNNSKGIVKFTKFKNDSVPVRDLIDSATFYHNNLFEKIHSTVEIGNGTKIKFYFEKDGEDFLEAKIKGTLDYFSTEEDNAISGRIDIDKGNLHYSIPMVKVKDFVLEPNSYIKMSDKITVPYLNLIASTEIRASTDGLIPDYNKVLTFKILLQLVGDLNDLKMKFDISTVTTDAIVSSRLAQLSDKERNINALNLMIRGSFLLNTKGNSLIGSTDMLDAQIDKFYANQLNQIISDNIHFVDLKFDVQSYFDVNSSSQYVFHRDLYFNVGKSMFGDRAKINYKGNIGAWSSQETLQSNSQFVQNELELEVKLTKDGAYRGVFFMKNKYEGLLEGELIETGGGIRIRKKYDSIKDIFKRKEPKQKELKNK